MAESGSPDPGDTSRVWLKPTLGFLAVVALLVLVGAAFRYEVLATLECPRCVSTRGVKYAGVHIPGIWAFESAPQSELHESLASTELFHGKCAHLWPVVALSPSGRPPSKLLNLVPSERNSLAYAYESSPEFRKLVLERLASGKLERDRAIELFSLPARPYPNQTADPAWRAGLDEANALLKEGGLPPHPAWEPARKK